MDKLNLIVICADTFRRDYLGCHGNQRVETPNLDRLAGESTRFNNAYGEGLPTIEARRVYFTGKSLLPFEPKSGLKDLGPGHLGWEPMENNVVTLSEILKAQGYYTSFVTDVLHYQKPCMNFHRAFDSWEFIRGQESDRWRTAPEGAINPADHIQPHMHGPGYDKMMGRYLANTRHWQSEQDVFCAQVVMRAAEWVEDLSTQEDPFFMWIDMFDPHEPWDPPDSYLRKYWDGDIPTKGRYLFGYGAKAGAVKPEDIPLIEATYAAEVTLVDRWIGHLLETIDQCGILDHSMIVFTSDHGTSLYEHGFVQKADHGLYGVMTGLPLLIRHPDSRYTGKAVDSLISSVDFMPSFLDLMGFEGPGEQITGQSFKPIMDGQTEPIRDHVISGWNNWGSVRDLEWNYQFPINDLSAWKEEGHVYNAEMHGERLYDLKNDPEERNNVKDSQPEAYAKMRELAVKTWGELPEV